MRLRPRSSMKSFRGAPWGQPRMYGEAREPEPAPWIVDFKNMQDRLGLRVQGETAALVSRDARSVSRLRGRFSEIRPVLAEANRLPLQRKIPAVSTQPQRRLRHREKKIRCHGGGKRRKCAKRLIPRRRGGRRGMHTFCKTDRKSPMHPIKGP